MAKDKIQDFKATRRRVFALFQVSQEISLPPHCHSYGFTGKSVVFIDFFDTEDLAHEWLSESGEDNCKYFLSDGMVIL